MMVYCVYYVEAIIACPLISSFVGKKMFVYLESMNLDSPQVSAFLSSFSSGLYPFVLKKAVFLQKIRVLRLIVVR